MEWLIIIFSQSGANFLFTYYIPIYFQSIDGTSAAESGIRNLPLIVGSCKIHALGYLHHITDSDAALFAAISGVSVGIIGYFVPFLVLGSAIFTIGAGLVYTLNIGSSAGKYIGYQIILGVGQGLCIQIPVIAGQAFSQTEDIPTATAMVLCTFQLPGDQIHGWTC